MLKRGGIIIALGSILILCAIFSGIENFKGLLPDIKLKEIRDWEFDTNESNNNTTYISANITIENIKPIHIQIIENYIVSRWDVVYNDTKDNPIEIARASFQRDALKSETIRQKKDQIISYDIPPNKNRTIPIFFKINNTNLSTALYNHIVHNNEQGNLTFRMNLTIKVNVSLFNISLNIPVDSIIPAYSMESIKTDILEKIDNLKYNYLINETNFPIKNLSNVSSKYKIITSIALRFLSFFGNITINKNLDSNLITINITKQGNFKTRSTPIYDINIGEKPKWVKNQDNKLLNVKQEIIVSGLWWSQRAFTKYLGPFLENTSIYLNNESFGSLELLSPVQIRKFGELGRFQNVNYFVMIKNISLKNLGKWLHYHIENNENTIISFKYNNITKKSFPIFNKTLSQILGNVTLNKNPFNWNGVKDTLSLIQYILVITISGITSVLFSRFFWKRKNKRNKL